MTQFISTDDGYISANRVVRVYHRRQPDRSGTMITATAVEYIGADGHMRAANTTCGCTEALERIGPVIAAQPGYFIIYPRFDEETSEKSGHTRTPIIAWRLTPSVPMPLGVDGEPSSDDWAVLDPTGRVTVPLVNTWDSVEEFLREQLKLHTEWLEREQHAAPAA